MTHHRLSKKIEYSITLGDKDELLNAISETGLKSYKNETEKLFEIIKRNIGSSPGAWRADNFY